MYLGKSISGNDTGKVVGYQGSGHILTIGPTRSGKSRRLLIPNLLMETGRSMLVVDMKGELAELTAAKRIAAGGRVVALDPFGLLARRGVHVETIQFNPMDRLDPEDESFVDEAMVLAEALIQVNPKASEPHWSESAQELVCGLIMWVKYILTTEANLLEVRSLLCRPVLDLTVVARAAQRDAKAPAAIARKLAKFVQPARESRELDSILSTAQTQTRFLDSPGIARSLSRSAADAASGPKGLQVQGKGLPLDFHDMKAERITVYLVLPPDKLMSHAKWLRLVISSAMTAMQRSGPAHGRPEVLFMLDEFPQLGRMAPIETAVSLNAGYGVKVWAAVQHLGQLKDLYDDNWETFLSAGCVTAFAPRDVFTREHLTKLIGTGSKQMIGTTVDAQGQTSVNRSVQKDDLISPHQWRAMKMGEHFAFIPTDQGQAIKLLYVDDFTRLGAA